MKHWLIKSEPDTYSFADLQKDGSTVWDGIRNYQARNYLKEMKQGDRLLFYHSGKEKSVVGVAEVSKPFFPESNDPEERWVAVEIIPLEQIKEPVSLQKMKESGLLPDLMLFKQSRLSVIPLSEEEYKSILTLK